MMMVTVIYVVNISGVSARFLFHTELIRKDYKQSINRLATFQALSWEEDRSTAIYDPFATRNEYVMAARKRLRENVPKISTLKLEEPEDSKVWWHLRELVVIEIMRGRIMMEMMVLVCIFFSLMQSIWSLTIVMSLHEMSAITIVTAVIMSVMFRFLYIALSEARDINLMSLEHTCLLHNVVAEMNMPLRPQMPLDSHLQQERFLLQVATLIEKQPPPETVASWVVSPQLFSLVMAVVGGLAAFSLCNLALGLVKWRT